jgi:hypothetical protein
MPSVRLSPSQRSVPVFEPCLNAGAASRVAHRKIQSGSSAVDFVVDAAPDSVEKRSACAEAVGGLTQPCSGLSEGVANARQLEKR